MGAPVRYILVVAHTGRQDSLAAGVEVCTQLIDAGVVPVLSEDERRDLLAAEPSFGHVAVLGVDVMPSELELVIVLGGDGTILRAAEMIRGCTAPLLGVNLGTRRLPRRERARRPDHDRGAGARPRLPGRRAHDALGARQGGLRGRLRDPGRSTR